MRPTILFAAVMATIWNLQLFDSPYVMTKGGPGYASTTIVMYIYQQAFKFDRMGLAATMAIVLLVIILALAAVRLGCSGARSSSEMATMVSQVVEPAAVRRTRAVKDALTYLMLAIAGLIAAGPIVYLVATSLKQTYAGPSISPSSGILRSSTTTTSGSSTPSGSG